MLNARALFVLAAVAVAGCESLQDKTRDAEEAQHAADRKVAEVTQVTQQKEIEVQQKTAKEIARLEREGAKNVGEAENSANRKTDQANEALWQARDQARLDASKKLDDLDRDAAALSPRLEMKLSTATAAPVVAALHAKAAAVRKSILDLDQCNADSLESLKKSIKAQLDDFEHALSDAKSRLY